MPQSLDYLVVDAFASGPYTGNPAGVALDADALQDEQMLAIARELHTNATAFVSAGRDPAGPLRLRWFTAKQELSFCGHATLATAHVLRQSGGIAHRSAGADSGLQFETAAGLLRVREEALAAGEPPLWWLEMPPANLRPENANPMRMCELLGISINDVEPRVPVMRTRDNDVILLVQSWQRLVEMRPNFHELGVWGEKHDIRGFCVATLNTLSKSVHVHSRFFAPAIGINEDPVTGSVHGPLATLLVMHGLAPSDNGRAMLSCIQGEASGRTGLVRAQVDATTAGFVVQIGGQCCTTLTGSARLPESAATPSRFVAAASSA